MDWQPIESAPKDAPFLAAVDGWFGEISGLAEGRGLEVIEGSPDERGDPVRAGLRGVWYSSGGDYYATWVRATHWMPLPEPPKE